MYTVIVCDADLCRSRSSSHHRNRSRVEDTVTTGGLPEVHPLTIIMQAVTIRRMNAKPEVLPAMVPDIMGDRIII
jgi:hypothetical protein